MSANGTSIYTGPWVNWSHGLVLGSTITLSARNGAILTSFIATFVTVVGAQLWKILCFILHHIRASQAPKDGLYHQHQNVFRNSSTPGGAAWSFMMQSWHWWGRAHHALVRSLPWVSFSTSYLVIFAVLSIFGTSEVTKTAGQDRLVQSSQCGYWTKRGSSSAQSAFEVKVLKDSQDAAVYVRNCYNRSVDALGCNTYATPYIRWEGKDADCPYKDGICYGNNTYQMDTGFIDSHHDLGMNTPEKERLKYRRVTTCSVLRQTGYAEENNATQLVVWNYGPSSSMNSTFVYSRYSVRAGIGYTVGVTYSNAGYSNNWEPAASLNRTDADLQLVWIAANSILYDSEVDDPVFSAHLVSPITITDGKGRKRTFYEADGYLGVIACADQHQVCHDDICTRLSSRNEVFSSLSSQGLTMIQRGIIERISFANVFTGIAQVINGRSGSALRAFEAVVNINQEAVPPNQWQIEVSSWFSTGLVMLQKTLQDYVSPTNMVPSIYVNEPQNPIDLAMCHSQKTQATNGTISFSVLGLGIILIVGTLVILASFVLETVVGWIGLKSHQNWVLDDKLQLQRMAFEARGVRWTNTNGSIPVTEAGERFASMATLAESQPLMGGDEKTVGMSVREVT